MPTLMRDFHRGPRQFSAINQLPLAKRARELLLINFFSEEGWPGIMTLIVAMSKEGVRHPAKIHQEIFLEYLDRLARQIDRDGYQPGILEELDKLCLSLALRIDPLAQKTDTLI